MRKEPTFGETVRLFEALFGIPWQKAIGGSGTRPTGRYADLLQQTGTDPVCACGCDHAQGCPEGRRKT